MNQNTDTSAEVLSETMEAFDKVVEGSEALAEKVDRVTKKIETMTPPPKGIRDLY